MMLPRSVLFAFARALGAFAVVAALLAATCGPVRAAGGETGNINGSVVSQSGAPVAGARIAIASPTGSYTQRTDAKGFFQFLGVVVDTYTISVEAQGFEPVSQAGITVAGGDTYSLGTLKLQPSNALHQIARVTARSAASAFQPNQTVPQFTVSGSILEAAQGKAASSDESAALLAVPGFQKDSEGNLILQGSQMDQVHYQVDGVDFTDPGFGFSANNLFFNGINRVQVVPGAGDPSQGNAGAGVVNLVVQRGTYPGTGILDGELLARPFDHQLNFAYGLASPSGRFSDYFSFFAHNSSFQYGPWGSSGFDNGLQGGQGLAYTEQQDFVNNFVYKFGANKSQSLQFLYINDIENDLGNYSGLTLFYPSNAADVLPSLESATGLTASQVQSVIGREQGQTSLTGPLSTPPFLDIDSTNFLKFEYDNSFNATTNLAVRFFHSDIFSEGDPSGGTALAGVGAITNTEQTSGGSRTGGSFEFDKQADRKNLLTVSGSYSFNRPSFSSLSPYVGLFDIGPDAVDFLRPPNPSAPVSAGNPCPIAGGCYLQQFFYTKGGTPTVPPLDLISSELQNEYGLGIRDQVQLSENVRLDAGLRYDLLDQGFGPNLYYVDENVQSVPGSPTTPYVSNYPFTETPHFLEPRLGASWLITRRDSLEASYGRSIISDASGELASPESFNAYKQFANIPLNPNFIPTGNPYTGVPFIGNSNCFPMLPYPVGATAATSPSYKGSVGTNLQLGKPCASYAQLLYEVNDAFFPDVTSVQPGIYDNFDLNFSHQFRNGSALKIAPFARQGYKVTAITAPLVFNPATGVYQPGTLSNFSVGKNTTTGLSVEYTLPERRQGLTGFVSLSYVNEFTTTPPAGDNPYGQDFSPIILPQSIAAGDLYRAGFVSPFAGRLGLSYKTLGGFRINPVINVTSGYPYGSGLLTPIILNNGVATNVPNTNVSDQYGPSGSSQFIDPANPGSITAPNIAASRGTLETASGGGELSRPQITADLTLEYKPPGQRETFGVQVLDLFNNAYYGVPLVSGNYYPVSTGVAGPLTGQSVTGAAFPGQAPLVNRAQYPYGAYNIPTTPALGALETPTTFRLYFQYDL
jgi:hypothetical protein